MGTSRGNVQYGVPGSGKGPKIENSLYSGTSPSSSSNRQESPGFLSQERLLTHLGLRKAAGEPTGLKGQA